MIKQVKTTKKYMIYPARREQDDFDIKLTYDNDFMRAWIPVCAPEDADLIISYPMPGTNKCIEAEEAFFKYVTFSDTPAEADHSIHQHFHLTTQYGWSNDPNGLFYMDGIWHCCFQHNPLSTQWLNVHWSHAVSKDLIHWEHKGIALYPDKNGVVFSGTAFVDTKNASGLGKNTVLFYYTGTAYDYSTGNQCLAYSTDGGETFRRYAGNPVVPSISGKIDRDPCVAYDPEEDVYYMAVFRDIQELHTFDFFCSHDLLHWEHTDSYTIPPDGWECPGIHRMKDQADGKWKWVFTEANEGYYRIAEIHHGKVRFLTDARKSAYGNPCAGQYFNNAPDGKQICLVWVKMPQECRLKTWKGGMSLPMEVTLKNDRLYFQPYAVPERLAKLVTPQIPFEGVLKTGSSQKASFRFGKQEFIFDLANHRMKIDGKEFDLPEGFTGGRLFADNVSVEFFDDKGGIVIVSYVPDNTGFAAEGFDSAEYYQLESGCVK